MKKKFLNNFSWKILSVCLAAITWILIVNIDDPVITRTITDVPVEIENEEAVQEKDKVYEITEGGTVSVYVKGKRSYVGNLRASDILATADLSDLSKWNAVPIIVSCRKYSEREVEVSLTGRAQSLKIALEDRVTKQFQVSVVVNGSVAEGFFLSQPECRPNLINVSGGETAVNRIDAIKVTLGVEGISDNINKKLKPKAYDAEGKEIDSANLHFSSDSIRVKADVWETKTVPVSIGTTGDVAYGYELGGLNYEPTSLLLAGTPEGLSQINRIYFTVDVSNASMDKEVQIILADELGEQLPDNVRIAEGIEYISVQALINRQEERRYSVSIDDIDLRNKNDKYDYSIRGISTSLEISVMGKKELLDQFDTDKYPVYIDVKGVEPGTHIMSLKLDNLPDMLYLTNSASVTVVVEKRSGSGNSPGESKPEDGGNTGEEDDSSGEEEE